MRSKIEVFEAETDPFRRNRRLYGWLRDDARRRELYEEMKGGGFPVLQLKSLLRDPADTATWPSRDLYVASGRADIAHALRNYSVQPYATLDSHGRFLLGLDDPRLHDDQKRIVVRALDFGPDVIQATAREAVRQACIRPFKTPQFDLVKDVAQQAALRFAELLFGMPPESHVHMEAAMLDTYRRLTFQIIGRHFVSDSGLPPLDSALALRVKTEIEQFVRDAAKAKRDADLVAKGLSPETVIHRLFACKGTPGAEDPTMVALGTMAGTVGNLTAAISIAIAHFFEGRTSGGTPLLKLARAHAHEDGRTALAHLIEAALKPRPAAPFLTRVARGNAAAGGGAGPLAEVPDGAFLLLAMGADPDRDLEFGWQEPGAAYRHRCPGRVFVSPLVTEAVREVLRLPGLSRVIAPETGRPAGLKKTWGAICETFPLQYQRARRLNQQPLHVALPIKQPILENAHRLEQITRAGAHIVEDALAQSEHVHFAWFNFDETRTHLCMSTAYDGDFDTYVEFFARLVPLFDVQFDYLDVDLPRKIHEYPKEFVNAIRKYNRDPIAGYFFSAYPLTTVSDIDNASRASPASAASPASPASRVVGARLDGDMPAPESHPRPSPLRREEEPDVQRLALTGYDSDRARHLVLRVRAAGLARGFLGRMLRQGLVTFGESGPRPDVAVNIGFTYRGLQAMELPDPYLEALATKSPAFAAGAPVRAGLHLGDSDDGAAEHWEPPFALDQAHVWLSLHADAPEALDRMTNRLRREIWGEDCFEGWEPALDAAHLTQKPEPKALAKAPERVVHFGFRDNLAQPVVVRRDDKPDLHSAGELLLGHANDKKFNLWVGKSTSEEVARFARNASFGVLRKIEQHEGRFNAWLERAAPACPGERKVDYLKAKLCGRWPNGALLQPGELAAGDQGPGATGPFAMPESARDPAGNGCPFGSHIRRANPRQDHVVPPGLRTLFRRGMPYGPRFDDDPDARRGLMGVFFCASIEDQFEGLISQWIENKPMGPDNRGQAKDPLVGHHDDPDAVFAIPIEGQDGGQESIQIKGLEPFVTTRGTLYALFPGRQALGQLADEADRAAAAQAARPPAATGPAAKAVGDPDAFEAGGAPRNRFCDIVMEGGITSGIIYTTAVAELSQHYRFRSIGGSSIGAFAAALTAAAEFQRRHGSAEGFGFLKELPSALAAPADGDPRTLLERLFNPQPNTLRLFRIFLAALNRGSAGARVLAGAREAVKQYGGPSGIVYGVPLIMFALGCLGGVAAFWTLGGHGDALLLALSLVGPWWLLALLALAVALCVAVVAGVLWDLARGLVPNGFGLCRGHGGVGVDDQHDLVAFMHGAIQEAAGLGLEDMPLTFGRLWAAPSAPSEVLGYAAGGDDQRSIDLQVYVSNLAQGRPYRFPLDKDDERERLFFLASDLKDYFPAGLLGFLEGMSAPYAPGDGDPPLSAVPPGLRELPIDDLPVVVAARLAMSFPFLISAVPLWVLVYKTPYTKPGARRCWMSDGGLCSDFPIHLFDCWLPRWPTFGISLQDRARPEDGPPVWLPTQDREGRDDACVPEPVSARASLSPLAAFAAALFRTTWRWNDSTTMRMPGVRDRVARIYLLPGQGGINIRMTGQQIATLASDYGLEAARVFIDRFARPGSPGWAEHRWVRFNTLLQALRERVSGLAGAAGAGPDTLALTRRIAEAERLAPLTAPADGAPWPSEDKITRDQAVHLQTLLDALLALEKSFTAPAPPPAFKAVPKPSLRIRHPT